MVLANSKILAGKQPSQLRLLLRVALQHAVLCFSLESFCRVVSDSPGKIAGGAVSASGNVSLQTESGPKLPGVNGFLSLRLPKWITSNGDELVYKQRNSLYLQAAFPRVDEWYW